MFLGSWFCLRLSTSRVTNSDSSGKAVEEKHLLKLRHE